MTEIAENLARVTDQMERAARRAGRNPKEIRLVAVSKTVGADRVLQAIEAGVKILGENYVQEAQKKINALGHSVAWHFIGHLQTNKVKQAVGLADLIHSLDRITLAKEISHIAQTRDLSVPVLVQVNISGEESKYGLAPEETTDFLTEIFDYPGLKIQGLMTMAPFVPDPEEVRPVFRGLAMLAEELNEKIPGVTMRWLSMGMTNDYEVAVEEGANLVRVGSGIFASGSQ